MAKIGRILNKLMIIVRKYFIIEVLK